MVSQLVNGNWHLSPWGGGGDRNEGGSSTTECKVERVGIALQKIPKQRSMDTGELSPISPLRLLFWVSLFAGARGQLTDPFPAQFKLLRLDGMNGFILNGEAAGDWSGFSVSSAGDVNGDGLSDLVIGACLADPSSGTPGAGKSYVIFGSRTPISGGVLDLSSLNGMNGFIINGEAKFDRSGFSVSSAGDVNGDGLSDLVIGANKASPSGRSEAGKSYVIFGSRSPISGGVLELSRLDGMNGFILNGEAARNWSGYSVSSAGDVNGDGLSDLVIGAHLASPSGRSEAGKSYVIFGSRTPISRGVLELSSLDGMNGFIIIGEAVSDRSGYSVSRAGDVNGDGLSDLVLGAHFAGPSGRGQAGKSYVIFGSRTPIIGGVLDLSNLDGTNGFILNGEAASDRSGISVSHAGDVNGDGIADLVIGAYYADPSGRLYAGKSYVIYGSRTPISGGVFELSSLNGMNGFILNGEATNDWSGFSISSAGDVNGDCIADLVIGAYYADPSSRSRAGKSYVLFGSRTPISGGVLELSSLGGMNGFILNGVAQNDYSGYSVSSAGDVNGDGIADLVIGAYQASPSGKTDAGKSYVIYGRNLTMCTQPETVVITPSLTINSRSTLMVPTTQIGSTSQQGQISSSTVPDSLTGQTPSADTLTTVLQSQSTESDRSHRIDSSSNLKPTTPILLPASPTSDSTPVIIGVATGVGLLASSLFAGMLFYLKKRSKAPAVNSGTSLQASSQNPANPAGYLTIDSVLPEMQSARAENIYHQITPKPPTGHYNAPPQEQTLSNKENYDTINFSHENRAMEQYQIAKRHENYDDLNQIV